MADLDRRKFFGLLGAGAATVTSLRSLVPEATATEVRSDKQYVVRIGGYPSIDRMTEMEGWLQSKGLNCIVVPSDFELFEVNHGTPDR
jgi:hypothetical protein